MTKKLPSKRHLHTSDYLSMIGVPDIPRATSPFDPGYDPATLESHLDQSAHLMSILKISMLAGLSLRRPPRAER
jgi:phosphosulfolactate synthase